MPTRNVPLTGRQEDATRLKALRKAARFGLAALDRGEFCEFEEMEDLRSYLNDLSDKVISRTAR
jgi:antitoxin ParD1/3/4